MRILVSGSAGFIGTALVEFCKKAGHEVVRLVRVEGNFQERQVKWAPDRGDLDPAGLEDLGAVVHLAGENVFGLRWTSTKKKRIRDSRVEGTALLCGALAGLARKPMVLISSSAVGFYGNRGEEVVDETSAPGTGFLADVCRDWEAATLPARNAGIRVVNLRTSLVLDPSGGALKTMLPAFKLGAGGTIGSGNQYMPWILREELLRVIEYCLLREDVEGPVNAATPQPVTNREFTKILAQELHRPAVLPVPSPLLHLIMGEAADELLLASCRAVPTRLHDSGFQFEHSGLHSALHHLLG
ncbi:MAG: TIGR01777 family protein [Candidatus Hydrogenedentes bacterium]|nr:TIGR01777 family protein [Candidatus Hydrogenedentota bacterium]